MVFAPGESLSLSFSLLDEGRRANYYIVRDGAKIIADVKGDFSRARAVALISAQMIETPRNAR